MASDRDPDKVLVDIIDYVYDYEVVEPRAWQRARLLLLDSFGCAIQSLSDPAIRSLIGPYVPNTVTPHGFCLPGTMIQEDPVKGAFDFGTMIRYLDHNDALGGKEWGHPSDNLGALVAVMDWLERTGHEGGPPRTIKTLLTAMIKAYEIEGCFQMENSFNEVSIDHTILVKVASTAVVAWLVGLPKSRALAALSQAWMDGHPPRTYRAFPNANPRKGWAAGDACARAIHLVLLTMKGLPGGPRPLTAKRWGFYDSLFRGKEFHLPVPYAERIIHNTVVKLLACEGHVLTAAEAALQVSRDLRRRGYDPATSIEAIQIRTQRPALLITDKTGPLNNSADRDHCFQYIVAVVLLKGEHIAAEDYRDDSPFANSAEVDRLRDMMVLREDHDFTSAYYDSERKHVGSGIAMQLTDGTVVDEAVVLVPMGDPRHNDTAPRTVEKYKKNLATHFSTSEIEHLERTLDQDETRVSDFIDLWRRGAPHSVL